MEYSYFPGCNIPFRENGYELSARKVAEKIGIKLLDMPFNCCGLNTEHIDINTALVYSARNLAVAGDRDILTLCNGCYKTLKNSAVKLEEDHELKSLVNERLNPLDLSYTEDRKVFHLAEVLLEQLTEKDIKVTTNLVAATHAGCHIIRPKGLSDFTMKDLDRLVEMTGAKTIEYREKDSCCGAPTLSMDENLAMSIVADKFKHIEKNGAQVIVSMCPFCQIMLDTYQVKLRNEGLITMEEIPSVYLTQFIGLSLGIDPETLGLDENKTEARTIIESFEPR